MTRKFVTLNHHSANDYINFDVAWDKVQKFYLTQYNNRTFRHASLSTAHFVAYMWKFGNTEWQTPGGMPGIGDTELNIFKNYLRNGGGHIFYGMFPFETYPDEPKNFEQYVNSACKRLTERWNPWTGIAEPTLRADKCYGIDAAHFYIGDLGQDGRVPAVINWESSFDWWAARICGVERGEYAGPNPFGPQDLEIPDNPLGLPDWLSCYREDFDETPFYWFCGLQTLIPFKFPATSEFDAGPMSVGMHYAPIVDDTGQKLWAALTHSQKFAFIMDWINGSGPLAGVRVGAYIMSKNCKAERYMSWHPKPGSTDGKEYNDNWARFRIPDNIVPRQPMNLAEARLKPEMINSETCAYGKWKNLFTAFLDDMVTYANNHQNVIFFNDRESKDMVKQQYDGTVQVNEARIRLIAEYLANQDNWQVSLNEWGNGNLVTRPPNNAKIIINNETEYYSLSEAWWYMMAALKDLENGQSIQTRTLEPILGPYEPADIEYSLENSYLVKDWTQHNEMAGHRFQFAYIKKSANILYPNSFTLTKLGPEYTPPDISTSDRRAYLKCVRSFWAVYDVDGIKVLSNAAEFLWLMAKGLYNYFNNIQENVAYLPSHVLPKHFYKMNKVKVYPLTNQHNWFDLTQLWTLKPAVLKPDYR